MSDQFDPYYKWLGIAPKDQPPHHYRLLGIDPMEDDPEVIDSAANRVMTYLKELAPGDDAAHSQRIMNEVMQARLCLLNPKTKATYDNGLRAKTATNHPPPPRATLPSPKPQARNAPNPPSSVDIVATSPMPEQHSSVNWLVVTLGTGFILMAGVILIVVAFALRDGLPDKTPLAEGQIDTRDLEVGESGDNINPTQEVPADPLLSAKPFEETPSPREPERHAPTGGPPNDTPEEAGKTTGPTADPSKAEEATDRSVENEQAPLASPAVHAREPAPSTESQKRAKSSALEGYNGEIIGSITIEKRIGLARRMLKAATDKSTHAATRFVLLSEAHNLAIAAADATLVNEITDHAKRGFTIDRLPASEAAWDAAAATLGELSTAAASPADFALVAENGTALAGQAAADGWTETARNIASTALSAARKANDDELVRKVTLRLLDLQ